MLSLPAGTEMFHFPALPPNALCIQAQATPHDGCQVSPFGNPRITARLPAPRGLSQAPTSFIGSWCQDIHRMLLKTWLNYTYEPINDGFARNFRCSRSLCSSQDTDGTAPTQPPSGDLSARPFEDLAPSEAAASSGPNSVLTQPGVPCARSANPPRREAY